MLGEIERGCDAATAAGCKGDCMSVPGETTRESDDAATAAGCKRDCMSIPGKTTGEDDDSDIDGEAWVDGVAAAVDSEIVILASSMFSVSGIVAGVLEELICKSIVLTSSSERLLGTTEGSCAVL
jgi:hypothetical protein